ncbi:hypothetical protein GCM10027615_21140 [Plantactinospora veratri]
MRDAWRPDEADYRICPRRARRIPCPRSCPVESIRATPHRRGTADRASVGTDPARSADPRRHVGGEGPGGYGDTDLAYADYPGDASERTK